MNRYHIKTGFNPQDIEGLKDFTSRLNGMNWHYTNHSIDSIKNRAIDLEGLLIFVRDIRLDFKQIFEYYSDGSEIIKACYRISWQKDIDIILCLSQDKNIISIWLNSALDNHETLSKNIYTKGLAK
jgi:hypothetical protein